MTESPAASGSAPLWVEFDATGSTTADPNDWSFAWTTSDGASGTEGWIDTFQTPGSYTVTVTLTDGYGNTASQTVGIVAQ